MEKSSSSSVPSSSDLRQRRSAADASTGDTKDDARKKAAALHNRAEFGGPVGAAVLLVFLPSFVVLLYLSCNESFCVRTESLWEDLSHLPKAIGTQLVASGGLLSIERLTRSMAILLVWMLVLMVLERVLPARIVDGMELPGGRGRLTYRINGHLTFWAVLVALLIAYPQRTYKGEGQWSLGPFPLSALHDLYLPLIVSSIALCLLMSVVLFLASFRSGSPPPLLSEPGNTGHPLTDFFMGRELNPRTYGLDWKFFCELRPGLIGWVVLLLGAALKQMEEFGLGGVSPELVLLIVFQGLYVWDALKQEPAVLSTMDITTDGFGFMLVFGDLCWVPFTYSLQARIILIRPPNLPHAALAAIAALNLFGYWIFRSSNSQKDAFRRDPNAPSVRHLKYIETKTGRRLLTSGWWGRARKINYTGDWLMGLAWCLLCGGWTPIAYYYAGYFLFLLLHRALRDEWACSAKYGADWQRYKQHVPYVLIPGVI
ncbi:unnamed protein product [Vitrella brassicaformis CCMP3155]|uniref:Delta(14)-sterol reductase n=1 Tax=Vitrella brassicaformis (strain CCMP3155) TaxID=1169540 RepID=A0A0G4G8R8_VITBC|nr:unnamed protein product [Vitrella brassicaformis CCMP3155]|eukprot:CEM25112.1 unnamed protein product [Vitrella brassicaformis CCMP3155]